MVLRGWVGASVELHWETVGSRIWGPYRNHIPMAAEERGTSGGSGLRGWVLRFSRWGEMESGKWEVESGCTIGSVKLEILEKGR